MNSVAMSAKPIPGLKPLPIEIDETGMEFTQNFVRLVTPIWHSALVDNRGILTSILEIGSHEGRSANTFLQLLPKATISCIDIFNISDREARFDTNLARYGDRVEKLKGPSSTFLSHMVFEGRQFDLIYIDGDHKRQAVHVDSLLSWLLLKPGGIMIWDDYMWRPEKAPEDRPQQAIDWFLDTHAGAIEILHQKLQVIIRRVI